MREIDINQFVADKVSNIDSFTPEARSNYLFSLQIAIAVLKEITKDGDVIVRANDLHISEIFGSIKEFEE